MTDHVDPRLDPVVDEIMSTVDADPRAIEWATNFANRVLAAADKAATIDPCVEHFINGRPGYIQALKDTRGTDDQSDYWRWQGHAEARRQLATVLGYTVPHEPGETTKRATE